MTEQPHRRVLADLKQQRTALGDRIPEVCKGFAQFGRSTMTMGNLGRSTKKLKALVIGAVNTRDQTTGHRSGRCHLPPARWPRHDRWCPLLHHDCEFLDADHG
jgi:hypothetical protein